MLRLLTTTLLLTLLAMPAGACFGPKLYLGTGQEPAETVLFELVALYVKEKTGTESVRVELEGSDPAVKLRAEEIDMAFFTQHPASGTVVLEIPGLPLLVAGPRPLNDLQFTTVAPALKKLDRLLGAEQVKKLVKQVEQGAFPGAAARRFLMSQGWI